MFHLKAERIHSLANDRSSSTPQRLRRHSGPPGHRVATVPALAATTGTATLTANDGNAFDGLGQSTAISSNGDVAVAGSPGHGTAGAAYVFTNNGQGFSQSAELTPPSTDSGDDFGTSAAISGDGQTVVVGADGADNDNGATFK